MKNRSKVFKLFRRLGWSLLGLVGAYLGLLLYPNVLFAHRLDYRNVAIHSDAPIDPHITTVIDDALARLSRSEFYDSTAEFRIFLCNNLWRFGLFTQGNSNAGAVTHYHLSRNIFVRPSDIPRNRIIPPDAWYFARNPFTFADRPLSYYFAHEMTHVLQSRHTGLLHFSTPRWLTEGYADYIGKGGDFDIPENLRLWQEHAPELDPSQGLYRLYHLQVALLMDCQGLTARDLYENVAAHQ